MGKRRSSFTGLNIRNNLSSMLGSGISSFFRTKAEPESEKHEEVKQNINPYAKHNINHGVMYTPDGEQIDAREAHRREKQDSAHLYPHKRDLDGSDAKGADQISQSQQDDVKSQQDNAVN